MNPKSERLKELPSVDEVLRHSDVAQFGTETPRPHLVAAIREAIDVVRKQVLAGDQLASSELLASVIESVRLSVVCLESAKTQRVINATGILLHTNLGRAPLADRAIERVRQAASYANVELDLGSGRRNRRGERAMQLLAELSGAEDAIVVNNCAAATVLALQALAAGREVIVSRSQLVEIGGGFRLPDVFTSAGVRLREVGTTNRTYLKDYEAAINDQSGAIIRVHRSNFSLEGFVTEPSIEELVAIPRPKSVPVIDDLGSGCFTDLSPLGMSEPTVQESVRSGADLSLFSGDKLLGGPQCGIVVGKQDWIGRLSRHPLMRALRVDKMTLAAIEATCEIHLSGNAHRDLPLLRMMFCDADEVRRRCDRVCSSLNVPSADRVNVPSFRVDVVECQSQIGGGSVPGSALASHAVRIQGDSIDTLAARLRQGESPVQARVAHDALLLDLRTVEDRDVASLSVQLQRALVSVTSGKSTSAMPSVSPEQSSPGQ